MELQSYGFVLLRARGLDETRALADRDPSVQAGRLSVEVMTWSTRKGSVRFDPLSRAVR